MVLAYAKFQVEDVAVCRCWLQNTAVNPFQLKLTVEREVKRVDLNRNRCRGFIARDNVVSDIRRRCEVQ